MRPCAYSREPSDGPGRCDLDRPQQEEIHELHAALCHGLADPSRIAILYELGLGTRNVGQLSVRLALPQPTVSRHLRVLRDRQLVTAHRQANLVWYELADDRVVAALDLLRAVLRDRLEARGVLAESLQAASGIPSVRRADDQSRETP